jgi:hypothetical protein
MESYGHAVICHFLSYLKHASKEKPELQLTGLCGLILMILPPKNHVFAPKPFPREELFNPSRRYMNPELM